MNFSLSLYSWNRYVAAAHLTLMFMCVCVFGVGVLAGTAEAQALPVPPLPSASKPSAVKPAPPTSTHPLWNELSAVQKQTLLPLAATWDTMEPPRKRKWLSVVHNYRGLTSTEQKILQSRMAEWAALSPQERTLARLNYSESKKVAISEKSTKWDNYQALTFEDRKAFEGKSQLPRGAAVAPKAAASNQLTQVPVTRRNPSLGSPAPPSTPIDRKTLLPKPATAPMKSSPASQ